MRFLKAERLFNGHAYLADDSVLVLDHQNVLKDVVKESELEASAVERVAGIVTPGFVNAHCHLELSHLAGRIPKHTGLPGFAQQVVSLRNTQSKEEIAEHMQQADTEMWNGGIVAVGDISNTADSFKQKSDSRIHYHTFVELLGLNPKNADTIFGNGKTLLDQLYSFNLSGNLTPHAPYSTSRELVKKIAHFNSKKNQPTSMHNQESAEENKFFEGKKSAFEDLYRSLGLDITWFKAPGTTSLRHYKEVLPEKKSLLVHNTFTTFTEAADLENKAVSWCFCPGANIYIENRLPDLSVFSPYKSKICVGTDSLASNDQLDVVKEANLLFAEGKGFSSEDLLRALTMNGAEALGISGSYGQFIKGKNAGLNLLELKPSEIKFIKKLA